MTLKSGGVIICLAKVYLVQMTEYSSSFLYSCYSLDAATSTRTVAAIDINL